MKDILYSILSPTNIFWIVLTIAISSILGYHNSNLSQQYQALQQASRSLETKLTKRDSAILILHQQLSKKDSTYISHIATYDSLEQINHEIQNTTYNISADSLTQLWTDRFSDHQH